MDILGVLGEAAIAVQGTQTAYTVPASKTARVRLQYRFTSGTNTTFRVLINGMEVFRTGALTSGNVHFTSNALIINTAANDAAITGATEALTCMPYQREWFLSAGDTVQYVIGTADCSAMNFQVVGAELDAA